jgi:hypothetical protein
MPWAAEVSWPGGLGFSGRPVKSGGAEAVVAAVPRGEEVARYASGSGWDAPDAGGDASEEVGAALVGCGGGGDAMAWRGRKQEGRWTALVGPRFLKGFYFSPITRPHDRQPTPLLPRPRVPSTSVVCSAHTLEILLF